MPSVTIVVPCYNEEKRFPSAVFSEYLGRSAVHFLFVDDGSKDKTSEVLSALCRQWPGRTEMHRLTVNSGKAEAVRTGVLKALDEGASDYVGFWDADLATPLEAIGDFVTLIESRPDIAMVFGSRVKLLGRKIERRPERHYLGRIFATAASMVLKMPIYDTQCGAKLFRVTPTARTLFDKPFISRWVFDVEIIARFACALGSAKAASSQIYEFPLLEWRDVKGSKLKSSDFFKAALEVANIYRKYTKGLAA